jgi:hypothetical protein
MINKAKTYALRVHPPQRHDFSIIQNTFFPTSAITCRTSSPLTQFIRAFTPAHPTTIQSFNTSEESLSYFPKDFLAHRNIAYATLYHQIQVTPMMLPCLLAPSFVASKEALTTTLQQNSLGRDDNFDRLLLNAATRQI